MCYLLSLLIIGSPVIFKQERPGLNAQIFTFYKFRTMSNDVDEKGILLPDKNRLNKFGKFLTDQNVNVIFTVVGMFNESSHFIPSVQVQ